MSNMVFFPIARVAEVVGLSHLCNCIFPVLPADGKIITDLLRTIFSPLANEERASQLEMPSPYFTMFQTIYFTTFFPLMI